MLSLPFWPFGPLPEPTLGTFLLLTFPAFSCRLGLLLLPSLSLSSFSLLLLPANPLSPFSTLAFGLFPRSLRPLSLPALALCSLGLLPFPASPLSLHLLLSSLEDLVSPPDVPEDPLGRLVSRVRVRVVLLRQAPEGRLDLSPSRSGLQT